MRLECRAGEAVTGTAYTWMWSYLRHSCILVMIHGEQGPDRWQGLWSVLETRNGQGLKVREHGIDDIDVTTPSCHRACSCGQGRATVW